MEEKTKSLKKQKEATKLTTSKLAVKLGLKTNEVNKKLASMGYLEKKGKDFALTALGKSKGGVMKSTGLRAYVLWDESLAKELEPKAE